MPLEAWGVTAAIVAKNELATQSVPTDSGGIIDTAIQDVAGDVGTVLVNQFRVATDTITEDTPEVYQFLAQLVRLGAACRAMERFGGSVPDALQEQFGSRWEHFISVVAPNLSQTNAKTVGVTIQSHTDTMGDAEIAAARSDMPRRGRQWYAT